MMFQLSYYNSMNMKEEQEKDNDPDAGQISAIVLKLRSPLSALPSARSLADSTVFLRLGTSSLPLAGQSKTWRKRVAPVAETFLVQRPQGRRLKGLAVVA